MKILFVLCHSGYLRHYDRVVEILAQRGHSIHLGLVASAKKAHVGREIVERLCARFPQVTCSQVSHRRDSWKSFLHLLRGSRDYVRYLHPRYERAVKLRERARFRLGVAYPCFLDLLPGLRNDQRLTQLDCWLRQMEDAVPVSQDAVHVITEHKPDLVLVTPLVELNSGELDYLKAARAMGVPTGLCVASWDNLTNKGIIQLTPDRVIVWNEHQKKEAVEMHHVPPERVCVTGAQTFDEWFSRKPSVSREAFCRSVGLDPRQPYVLYLCSSTFIAQEEAQFVDRWLAALRASTHAGFGTMGVLVRPHPYNVKIWSDFDASRHGNAAVYPRDGSIPNNEAARACYYDSIYYSQAVVGINTTGMIEAGIIGKVSHTIVTPEFADTQDGTLHFDYLVRDGFVKRGDTMDQHFCQLAETLANQEDAAAHLRSFVQSFVRPRDLEQPCAPLVAQAIEEIVTLPREQAATPRRKGAMERFFIPVAARLSGPIVALERLLQGTKQPLKQGGKQTAKPAVVPPQEPSICPLPAKEPVRAKSA